MIDPGLMDMIMRLRSRGISDNRLLKAMEQVPRKYFVNVDQWTKAYDEQAMPISCGQSLSAPLTIAMLTQTLDVEPSHKVFELGAGSGYHAAILSHMSRRVYSVERYHQLLKEAESRFSRLERVNIVTRHGDGLRGWKGQAPFDRIIVTCALSQEPKKLLDQLEDDGVLVAVIKGNLTRIEKQKGEYTHRVILPLTLPMVEKGKSKIL